MNQSDPKAEHLPVTPERKAILFSALTLVSGIIIGAGLTLIVTGNSNTQKSLPPAPEYMSGRMVKRIAEELKLPPEQREQLGPIVQKHMKAMDDIRQDARPKIMEEIEQMNDEIMAILDEGQQKLWQDKMKHMQEHFTRMRNRRGPDGGRRDRKNPDSELRRGERRPGDRFYENHPPEGQLPPEERPPIDDIAPPAP
jgi:hypothetical protein